MEYLEVYVPEEQELILEESKNLPDGNLKFECSASDSDSGRGSCDSRTLLVDQQSGRMEMDLKRPKKSQEDKCLTYSYASVGSPDTSSEKVKTWSSLLSPLTGNRSGPLNQPHSPEMTKLHCLSDNLYPTGALSSHFAPPGHKEVHRLNYQEYSCGNMHPHVFQPQTGAHQYLQASCDVNISQKESPANLQLPSVRSTEYVEVQRVNDANMVLLHPVSSEPEKDCPEGRHAEEYSKVKGVNNNNRLLLLQRKVSAEEMDICSYEDQQTSGPTDSGYTASITVALQKPAACIHPAMQVLDERAASGYVDTSMLPLPTY